MAIITNEGRRRMEAAWFEAVGAGIHKAQRRRWRTMRRVPPPTPRQRLLRVLRACLGRAA